MQQEPTSRYLAAAQWTPSTFEERGTTVPFTTPILACSRVRPDDRQGLVLLNPGFSETKSVYVMAWASLPSVVTLSLHDRALHKAILTANAVYPDAMRKEALNVAAMGLGGPEVQDSANQAIKEDQKYAEEIHCVLILFLLRDLRLDVSHIMALRLDETGVLERIKTELNAAINPLQTDPETLYQRVGSLAETLMPLGLATYGRVGRLRQLMSELASFQSDMMRRCTGDDSEADGSFSFAAEVANHTLRLAESIVQTLDTRLVDLSTLIRGWDGNYAEIQRLTARTSWLLDGWDYALGFARSIDDWRREELWSNLDTLISMLPIVPRHEGLENEDMSMRFAELVQRRRVGAHEDWRTGRIDLELKCRLEAAKAAALKLSAPKRNEPEVASAPELLELPADPDSAEPDPTDPAPVNPELVDPEPADPKPVILEPVDLNPEVIVEV